MLYIPLSLSFLSLLLTLIALSAVGFAATVELFYTIFPTYVTSVRDRWLEACYRIVLLAAVVYWVIVILQVLIGGGINAL